MTSSKKTIYDIFWYSAGTFIPLLIGFFRMPVFTRYYTTEEYGIYGLVFLTYSVISIFLYAWLNNAIWRFYFKYKKESRLADFFSNITILYLIFTIVLLLAGAGWGIFTENVLIRRLVLLVFVQFVVNAPLNYILIVYRLESKTSAYNTMQISRTVLTFGLQYLLTYLLHFRVETIPLAYISVDGLFLLILLPKFISERKIGFGRFSKTMLLEIFHFAQSGVVSNLTLLAMASSDRYMIAWFGTIEQVGIYSQVYNLSQVSIMALVNVFFAVIVPDFLHGLENNFEQSNESTNRYINIFIILVMPLTWYLCIFSDLVGQLLLGPEFHEGISMIPWIMISSFIYGLTLFSENRLKLRSQYRPLLFGFFASAGINILLNFIFLRTLTYKFAAVSTLIAYSFLFIYISYLDYSRNKFMYKCFREIALPIIVLVAQTTIIWSLQLLNLQLNGIFPSFILLSVFITIYFLLIIKYKGHLLKLNKN